MGHAPARSGRQPAAHPEQWLGHSSPATTSVYTHLTVKAEQLGAAAINQLMSDL